MLGGERLWGPAGHSCPRPVAAAATAALLGQRGLWDSYLFDMLVLDEGHQIKISLDKIGNGSSKYQVHRKKAGPRCVKPRVFWEREGLRAPTIHSAPTNVYVHKQVHTYAHSHILFLHLLHFFFLVISLCEMRSIEKNISG